MKKRFLCIGSISFDLIFQVDRLPVAHEKLRCPSVHQSCGGSAANTAWWLARLGHEVTFAGCVGNDTFGSSCLDQMSSVGINIEGIQKVECSTGIATVFTNANDKRMVTSSGANGQLNPTLVDFSAVQPGDYVHLSVGDDQKAMFLMQEARNRRAVVSCEFNGNRNAERIRHASYCFMNHDELSRWMDSDDAIAAWQNRIQDSDAGLAVTLGKNGAAYVTQTDVVQAPAVPTAVVDRTGGGDAFDAGFLHAIACGGTIETAIGTGLALAAHTVSRLGAMPLDVTNQMLAALPQPAIS